jgi:hypothetical protein
MLMTLKQRCLHNIITVTAAAVMLLITSTQPAWADDHLSTGQELYVPVYSHIYSGDKERPVYLAVTVSIRNTDPSQTIEVLAVDYYDSNGKLVQRYVEQPITLGPMASTRFVVKESDKAGGSGANFIVLWQSPNPVNPPLTEGIMVTTASQLGISFLTRGVPIVRHTP